MLRRLSNIQWIGAARPGRGVVLRAAAVAAIVAVAALPPRAALAGSDDVAGPWPAESERRPLAAPAASAGRESAALAPAEARPSGAASSGLGAARTVLSLGLVLGLAIAAAAAVKRVARMQGGLAAAAGAGGAAPAGILEIIGRYPIARGQKLILLRVDRRVLLLSHVAASRLARGGGFSTLCEITDPDDVASILTKARDAEGESLAAKFQSLLGRYGHAPGPDEREEGEEDGPPELRTIKLAPDGDRVELWDDQPMRLVGDAGPRAAAAPAEPDAVSAIRRRLDAMRGAGAGGRA